MLLPQLDDLLDTMRVVTLPLAVRFRGVSEREVCLFEGEKGWSEFSPFLEYGDQEAATWLRASIDFGWRDLPELHRSTVPINAIVPALNPGSVAPLLVTFPSVETVKVKVAERGQSLADDVARVSVVRNHIGQSGRIRIDANGGWTVDEALLALDALAPFDIEYVEQPVASVQDLARVRAHLREAGSPILVAADESIRKVSDPLDVARLDAADIIVVKAQPLGGIHNALSIIEQVGLPAVVSSAIDSAVGLSMGTLLAASIPQLEYACGLGTGTLLQRDVATTPMRDGQLVAERVSPAPHQLDLLTASAERADWWRQRVTRCYRLVEAG